MKFPIGITNSRQGYVIQLIECQPEIFKYPFIEDYLRSVGVFRDTYQTNRILPVYTSSAMCHVEEIPLQRWMETDIECERQSSKEIGFIFHTSRCGSTMFCQGAKCNVRLNVLSEPPIINFILAPDNDLDFFARKRLLKIAIHSMHAGRSDSQKFTLIKTRSWNVLESGLFSHCFPESKAIFIHRNPRDSFDSIAKKPPGWIRGFRAFSEIPFLHHAWREEYDEHELAGKISFMWINFCSHARQLGPMLITAIDYEYLKWEFFLIMRQVWGLEFSERERYEVCDSFRYNAKSSPQQRIPFEYGARQEGGTNEFAGPLFDLADLARSQVSASDQFQAFNNLQV